MNGHEEYTFHIDAYSPETIPMARLAQYLLELAGLLGHKEVVHFLRVEGGSVKLVHQVEFEAVPKVRARLTLVHGEHSPEDARAHYAKLNQMLREDNGVASLMRESTKILRFPGREIPEPVSIGPIAKDGTLDGMLVRIGGRDKTVHAHLLNAEGDSRACVVTRELAREMAPHLFGRTIRVYGRGRWRRNDQGTWELVDFRATRFQLLDDSSLSDLLMRLRDRVHSRDRKGGEPIARLIALRDDEIH